MDKEISVEHFKCEKSNRRFASFLEHFKKRAKSADPSTSHINIICHEMLGSSQQATAVENLTSQVKNKVNALNANRLTTDRSKYLNKKNLFASSGNENKGTNNNNNNNKVLSSGKVISLAELHCGSRYNIVSEIHTKCRPASFHPYFFSDNSETIHHNPHFYQNGVCNLLRRSTAIRCNNTQSFCENPVMVYSETFNQDDKYDETLIQEFSYDYPPTLAPYPCPTFIPSSDITPTNAHGKDICSHSEARLRPNSVDSQRARKLRGSLRHIFSSSGKARHTHGSVKGDVSSTCNVTSHSNKMRLSTTDKSSRIRSPYLNKGYETEVSMKDYLYVTGNKINNQSKFTSSLVSESICKTSEIQKLLVPSKLINLCEDKSSTITFSSCISTTKSRNSNEVCLPRIGRGHGQYTSLPICKVTSCHNEPKLCPSQAKPIDDKILKPNRPCGLIKYPLSPKRTTIRLRNKFLQSDLLTSNQLLIDSDKIIKKSQKPTTSSRQQTTSDSFTCGINHDTHKISISSSSRIGSVLSQKSVNFIGANTNNVQSFQTTSYNANNTRKKFENRPMSFHSMQSNLCEDSSSSSVSDCANYLGNINCNQTSNDASVMEINKNSTMNHSMNNSNQFINNKHNNHHLDNKINISQSDFNLLNKTKPNQSNDNQSISKSVTNNNSSSGNSSYYCQVQNNDDSHIKLNRTKNSTINSKHYEAADTTSFHNRQKSFPAVAAVLRPPRPPLRTTSLARGISSDSNQNISTQTQLLDNNNFPPQSQSIKQESKYSSKTLSNFYSSTFAPTETLDKLTDAEIVSLNNGTDTFWWTNLLPYKPTNLPSNLADRLRQRNSLILSRSSPIARLSNSSLPITISSVVNNTINKSNLMNISNSNIMIHSMYEPRDTGISALKSNFNLPITNNITNHTKKIDNSLNDISTRLPLRPISIHTDNLQSNDNHDNDDDICLPYLTSLRLSSNISTVGTSCSINNKMNDLPTAYSVQQTPTRPSSLSFTTRFTDFVSKTNKSSFKTNVNSTDPDQNYYTNLNEFIADSSLKDIYPNSNTLNINVNDNNDSPLLGQYCRLLLLKNIHPSNYQSNNLTDCSIKRSPSVETPATPV